ncbi:MAG: hypothetical protein M0R38_06325 [Bacteroidia bacterium]|nr:hypothetical protein [Bacteroidia bacterium]
MIKSNILRLLLSATFTFVAPNIHGQYAEEGHEISYDLHKIAQGFEFFDSSFKDKRVFFTGEDHRYIESNNNISIVFTKYLNKHFGVNHLILELGYTWGTILNTYVQTGDTAIFDVIKKSSYIAHYDYFNQLYFYNKTLPDSQKIIITGIDVTRDYSVCIHYLNYLIPNKSLPPDNIIVNIESIKALSAYLSTLSSDNQNSVKKEYYSYYKSIDSVIVNFHQHKADYQIFLDSNYTEFAKIIQCLEDNIVWNHYDNSKMIQKYIYREQYMLQEFKKLLAKYPNDKFYGQFGRCHIGQNADENECDWYNFRPIATRISELNNGEMKGKVMTIAIIYTDGIYYRDRLSDRINDLIDITPKNKIYAYDYNSDIKTTDSTDFAPAKYNYVIIDNKSQLPVSYTDSGPVYTRKIPRSNNAYYTSFGFNRSYSFLPLISSISLNKLNTALGANPLFKDFTTPIITNSIYFEKIRFRKNKGSSWGVDIGQDQVQQRDVDTGSSVRFGGFNTNLSFKIYRSFFKKRLLWLDLGLKLGYSQKHLTFEYPNNTKPTLGGFVVTESSKYRSSAFCFTPTLGASVFLFQGILIGAEGGYIGQSEKTTTWREKGRKIYGPNQRWSSIFGAFRVAFIFN